MKRVMVVLELEGGEAVVVHSKELMQHKEDIQQLEQQCPLDFTQMVSLIPKL